MSSRLKYSKYLPALLLAVSLLYGCDNGDRENTVTGSAGMMEPVTIQPPVDPLVARIDALKARLFDDAENEQLLSELGDAYFESQRFLEAIPIYEKAVSINPGNPDVLNDLGLSYFYTGDTEQGLATINKAIIADPAYKHAWLSKGFILSSEGRHEEALIPLNKVKELDAGGALATAADNFIKKAEGKSDWTAEVPD